MQLPSDSIGISDTLDYRECPQRFAFKMRRHVELPERFRIEPGELDEPPESVNWTNAYGSAVHEAIAIVERESVGDDEAIDRVWLEFQHHLEPEDIPRLKADLETFHERTALGYRLIANEKDMQVPLFVHEGRVIYFRFKVDALYQHMQNPGVFLQRDYKSSRWARTEEEVHKDLQQWSYNWALHEAYPEIESLIQQYDQLRFGVIPTRKNPTQRQQIKQWLIRQVKTILADDKLKPTRNQWCYTCPIMMDCRITHLSADYWKNRLGALAPEKKVGRKIVVQLTDDVAGFETYTEILPKVKETAKVMDRFIKEVESALKEMPGADRQELGFTLGMPRRADEFTPEAMERIRELVGPDFPHLVKITKKSLEEFYGEDSDTFKRIMALATKKQSSPPLKAKR